MFIHYIHSAWLLQSTCSRVLGQDTQTQIAADGWAISVCVNGQLLQVGGLVPYVKYVTSSLLSPAPILKFATSSLCWCLLKVWSDHLSGFSSPCWSHSWVESPLHYFSLLETVIFFVTRVKLNQQKWMAFFCWPCVQYPVYIPLSHL